MVTTTSKLALVIGIGTYDNLNSLTSPENDANDMASTLQSIGFSVTIVLNPKYVEIKHTLMDFKNTIQPGDMVLFYFSGYGTQWEDKNYLLPKDTPKMDNINFNRSAINAQDVLKKLTNKNPSVTIFLLDCCRKCHLHNPELDEQDIDSTNFELVDFKPMQNAGALIAFACVPNNIVIQRKEKRNGLFTQHLLQHFIIPNKDIGMILRDVRNTVMDESNDEQIPFLNDALTEQNICLYTQQKQNLEKLYDFTQISYTDLEIQQEIGRGFFGIVYKTEWLSMCSTVAIKILYLKHMNEKTKNQFLKEISLLQSIRCSNILTFYGVCMEEGKYALVMEYMSLGSLHKILHEDKIKPTWNERLSIALQTAIAINYLHQLPKPILHRHIKSSNLFLERAYQGYTVKLSDAGIAQTRNVTARKSISNSIHTNTFQWTAPEIIRLGRHTDKSDIFSLGIVYWELAACEIPYDGDDDGIIRVFVLAGERLEIPEDTPPSFRVVIEQCWEQKPNDRPSSSVLVQMIQDCVTEYNTLNQVVPRFRIEASKKSRSKMFELDLDPFAPLYRIDAELSPNRTMPNIPANARWKRNGITVAGGNGKGTATNQLNWPWGLFIDDDQTLVIADRYNNSIVQWRKDDTNGQVMLGGHDQENRFDPLDRPIDVLIEKATDSLIVADSGNRRVLRLPRCNSAKHVEILIDNVDCWGLAMDDQKYLYVSDLYNNEVRRYRLGDKNGTVVAGRNGKGNRLNQLSGPGYLFVDRQQNVYVSDNNNHRVMKWNKGAIEGIVVAGGQGEGDALTQLSYPKGIFVDTLGNLYVADSGNHRVICWPEGNKEGIVIVGGNNKGVRANQFNYLRGLSFDRHGNLYVVDWLNHRVQRFDIELTRF